MLLPHLEKATIDNTKLRNYALDPSHPEGRHKARVFFSALGLMAGDAEWLAGTILSNLRKSDAVLQNDTSWGAIYRVDMEIVYNHRRAMVRTGWICKDEVVRLITCFVIGGHNETA